MTVLVTRPGEDGSDLCQKLSTLGISNLHHPLLTFIQGRDAASLQYHLKNCHLVIAVSQHAVYWAQHILKHQNASFPTAPIYLAIGNKTAQLLQQYCGKTVISPKISDSEHLLDLPALKLVKNRRILILRGNGGRELIYQTLQQRGADVDYSEVYQRAYIPIDESIVYPYWKQLNIKQLVITSGDQLSYLITQSSNDFKHWLTQRELYIPSQRIEQEAKEFGFSRIINTGSAANSILLAHLSGKLNTGRQHDR